MNKVKGNGLWYLVCCYSFISVFLLSFFSWYYSFFFVVSFWDSIGWCGRFSFTCSLRTCPCSTYCGIWTTSYSRSKIESEILIISLFIFLHYSFLRYCNLESHKLLWIQLLMLMLWVLLCFSIFLLCHFIILYQSPKITSSL